jgi:hemolysin III
MNIEVKKRQRLEEIVNSTTHGIGLIAAIVFAVILIVRAEVLGNTWHIVTFSMFGLGMILLYLFSTLFHSAKNLRIKSQLNKADHSFIYVLIATTCTPFMLFGVQGYFGWILFGLIWMMTLAGIIYKVWFYKKRFRLLSTLLYILMGSIILVAVVPLIKNIMEPVSLWFLLFGGISFLVGTIFYQGVNIRFSHGYFHLLTLGGSICHFYAIYYLL